MVPKRLWYTLLTILALVGLGYAGPTLYRIYEWQRLQSQSLLTKVTWTIQELSDERFILEANYTFELRERTYSGVTLFKDKIYRNRWAAEQALNEDQNPERKVWFDPGNPSRSSLQKQFPLKDVVYSTVLMGIFFYFFYTYVGLHAQADLPHRQKGIRS